jgi:hypothetical protein
VTAAGWHPDPSGAPGRLRWWDGHAWTDHVHEPQPAAPPAAASPVDAAVLVVGPPQAAAPGCRVFELSDGAGGRLGRLVETSRGTNDSSFGAALSRSKGFQHATTREVRGPRGYPELVLTWGPSAPGAIEVTLPDRRQVGRILLGDQGWAVLSHDGRQWGVAGQGVLSASGGQPLATVTPDGFGGWRAEAHSGPFVEPLRSLVAATAATADLL